DRPYGGRYPHGHGDRDWDDRPYRRYPRRDWDDDERYGRYGQPYYGGYGGYRGNDPQYSKLIDRMNYDRARIAESEQTGRHRKALQWYKDDLRNARRDMRNYRYQMETITGKRDRCMTKRAATSFTRLRRMLRATRGSSTGSPRARAFRSCVITTTWRMRYGGNRSSRTLRPSTVFPLRCACASTTSRAATRSEE